LPEGRGERGEWEKTLGAKKEMGLRQWVRSMDTQYRDERSRGLYDLRVQPGGSRGEKGGQIKKKREKRGREREKEREAQSALTIAGERGRATEGFWEEVEKERMGELAHLKMLQIKTIVDRKKNSKTNVSGIAARIEREKPWQMGEKKKKRKKTKREIEKNQKGGTAVAFNNNTEKCLNWGAKRQGKRGGGGQRKKKVGGAEKG